MPRPRQRRALLAIPKLGGPHQPRQPGLRLASRGSGHRRRDVAASRRPRSSCQHLGTSTANECHAHAADKQPQRARRLGAGPEDGGRNRVVAGRKTATSGWPLQRLASPPQGAGQNAGGQGPKAAPPRAREQASRGCRLPRPATSGWPLQRLASPPQGAGQNAGGQGPKAARDGEQASRGSPCFRQPSMAAGAAGRHARAPKRPSAQGPQALRPQRPSAQRGRGQAGARVRVVFLGKRLSPAGKRVVDAGETSGHEAPHFSPSVAAALISPAAGLWAPGQRAPGPVRGHPPKEQ
ncbi:hypothetical protein POPTR_008G224183v4 [Populus trichocarpa]|uniref:Uncharacterized protein n=1 Tax=Populus trichocarpa TaxID=3694 RepID=A0ACC0SNG9_POPTR|nr:hypothetical protein POPTR_008G224183v4 [Populus trichocarpa]